MPAGASASPMALRNSDWNGAATCSARNAPEIQTVSAVAATVTRVIGRSHGFRSNQRIPATMPIAARMSTVANSGSAYRMNFAAERE